MYIQPDVDLLILFNYFPLSGMAVCYTNSNRQHLNKLFVPFLSHLGILRIPQDIYNHLENDHNLLYALRVHLWAGDYYLLSIYPCFISHIFE